MREYTIQMDADFLGQYPLKTFSKGTILFEKGKELEYLYYLVDGICAGIDLTVNGSQLLPLFYREGEFMGVAKELLLTGSNIPSGSCIAKTKICAYQVPVLEFRRYLRENPAVYQEIAKSVIQAQQAMLSIAHLRIRGNSVAVVCHCLCTLMQPLPQSPGRWYVSNVFTITDLAANLQLHRVTVSKLLKRLTAAGLIAKKSYGFEICQPKELRAYALGEKLFDARDGLV